MKHKLLLILFTLFISKTYSQTPGTLDSSFNSDDIGFRNGDGFNGTISKTILLSDETILVLGNFSYYNDIEVNRIAKLTIDGTLDTSFNPDIQINGIYDGLLDPDGKLLVRGSFSIDGQSGIQLIRLNQDGSLDVDFVTGIADQTIMNMVRQSDGKYILVGYFTTYNGQSSSKIIRLNSDGTIDNTYAIGNGFTAGFPQHIVLQNDGKIVVGGSGLYYNNEIVTNSLIRINTNGSKDTSFNFPITTTSISALGISNSGALFVSRYTSSMYFSGYVLNKIHTDGSLDNSFASFNFGYNGILNKIVEQTDGKILVSGYSVTNNVQQYKIVRRLADGTSDTTFNSPNFNQFLSNISINSDNTIIAAGQFTTCNNEASRHISILDNIGNLIPTIEPQGYGVNGNYVQQITPQPDGKLLVIGDFYKYKGQLTPRLLRIDSDGTRDETFNIGDGPNNLIYDAKPLSNGKIAVAGLFSIFNNTTRNRFAFLDDDGSLSSGYSNPNINGTVTSILPISDERLIIVGGFTTINGIAKNRIAIINQTNGTIDTSIDFGTGFNNSVSEILQQPDGKFIVYGHFTEYNNVVAERVVRLNTDGSIDTSFSATMNTPPSTAIVLSNGSILLGGNFTEVNGMSQNNITRLNTDGTIDASFESGTGFDNAVTTLLVDENDKLLVGGYFTTYKGVQAPSIVRLNANGSLDTSFDSGTGTNGAINTIQMLPDNKLLIGGNFTSYDGIGKNRLARIFGGEDGTLSDDDFNLPLVQLYPNPARDYFSISAFNSSIRSAKLFNINGQELQTFYYGFDQIFVGNLTNGIYFLQINTDNDAKATLKLIKQ